MLAVTERRFDDSVLTTHDAEPALGSLAVRLHDAGFDEHRAATAVGAPSPEHLLSNPARYAFFGNHSYPTPPHPAASVLTSLFVLNRDVPADWVTRSIAPQLIDELENLSLLSRSDEHYHGTVSITPYRGRFFLSDRLFRSPAPQQIEPIHGTDLVMPPHASSLLALETVAGMEDSFLDVGCGTGFLALNAGPRVYAAGFDLNPRCVAFATANAALNASDARFTVADFATHELDEPERFHNMLFNAPTLPSDVDGLSEFGQTTIEYVVKQTAAVAHRVLRDGGTAHVLGLVEVPKRFGSATDTVHHWLAGTFAEPVSVREIDTPLLTITRRQLADRRLSGQSLLVFGRDQAQRLMESLARRGTAAVALVIVAIPVTHTPGA